MKSRFKWRQPYDEERDTEAGEAAILRCEDASLAQEHYRDDADLNVLAKRFGLDKHPMPIAPFNPQDYGDFSDAPDLRTVLDRVHEAKERFMDLPAKMRARFNNQPGQLWAFVNDPENADEAVRLGLLQRMPEEPKTSQTETLPKEA